MMANKKTVCSFKLPFLSPRNLLTLKNITSSTNEKSWSHDPGLKFGSFVEIFFLDDVTCVWSLVKTTC